MSPYANASTIAPGSPDASRTTVQPSAEPPLAGFTISGSPTASTSAAITAAAPSSRNVSAGRVTDCGVCSPARAATTLATGLSKATRQAAGPAPTYGTPTSSRTSRSAPSSPVSPCRRGTTQSGRCSRSQGSRMRVDVALVDLEPGVAQRLGDPAARAQRHVTLVGQPAGEHQHAQRPGSGG